MNKIVAMMMTAMVAALLFCGPAWASDWTVTVPVSESQVDLWLTHAYGRVQIGPVVTWVDQDEIPEGDGIGGGLVATYDLLKEDAQFSVGGVDIPVQWFIGGKAEVMYLMDAKDLDPAPSLLTGFRFGSDKAGVSVVYEFALTNELWSVLVPREEQHVLSFAPYWRF